MSGGLWRNDMIDDMSGRLDHPPYATGRAEALGLTGKSEMFVSADVFPGSMNASENAVHKRRKRSSSPTSTALHHSSGRKCAKLITA